MQKRPGCAAEDFDVGGTVGWLGEVREGFGGGAFCLGEREEVAEGGARFTWFAVLVEDDSWGQLFVFFVFFGGFGRVFCGFGLEGENL